MIETKSLVWLWQDTDESWKEYEEDAAKKIEAAFNGGGGKSKAITVGKDKFVSLTDMKQFTFSGADKKGRNVKREQKVVSVTWSWDNNDHWEVYNDDTMKKIEKAYLDKEDTLDLDSERYISFAKMRQIRQDNEKRYRNIKRETEVKYVKEDKDKEEEEKKDKEMKDEEEKTESKEEEGEKKEEAEEEEEEEERVVKWFWDKGGDDEDEIWTEYSAKIMEKIEEKYQKYLEGDGSKTFDLDPDRHINFRKMRQVRNDDPERFRKVKRGFVKVKKAKKSTPSKIAKSLSSVTPTKSDVTPTKSDTPSKTPTKTDTPAKNDTPSKTDKNDTPTKSDTPSKTPTKTPDKKSPDKTTKSDNTPTKSDTPSKTPVKTTTTTTTTATSSDGGDKKKMSKRTYSDMTEDEKRELISQMLNDDQQTKKAKVTSSLLLPGEADILAGKNVMKYCLKPNRYFDDSLADLHFRTAESQFHRLMESNSQAKVTLVEYIVNPDLVAKFNKKKEEFEIKGHGKPVLAFHGTAEKNIFNICKINFCVPGTKGVQHATDTGWYGKGIYFSEYPDYSMGYIKDCTRLLLCKVLIGNAYQCKGMITGQPCIKGYDSHISPCGKELVIFSPDQILPIYVVHYSIANATNVFGITPTAFINIYKYSTIFSGLTFSFYGTLKTTHANLETMVKNNGGTVIKTAKHVNYLVTNEESYIAKSAAVLTALTTGGTFIVSENFVLESVNAGKLKKASKYGFDKKTDTTNDKDKVKDDSEVKPVPLTAGLNGDGEDDDGEDEKPLPMCKYGENCYRKNADHFKEFAHPWLI